MRPQNTIKDLLGKPQASVLVGVHNALGAWLAQEAGADGLWISSFEIHTAPVMARAYEDLYAEIDTHR